MKNKKAVIGVIALLVVVLLLLGAYFIWKPKGKEGEKTISVEVIANDETVSEYTIKTQEKFLRKALEEKEQIPYRKDRMQGEIEENHGAEGKQKSGIGRRNKEA